MSGNNLLYEPGKWITMSDPDSLLDEIKRLAKDTIEDARLFREDPRRRVWINKAGNVALMYRRARSGGRKRAGGIYDHYILFRPVGVGLLQTDGDSAWHDSNLSYSRPYFYPNSVLLSSSANTILDGSWGVNGLRRLIISEINRQLILEITKHSCVAHIEIHCDATGSPLTRGGKIRIGRALHNKGFITKWHGNKVTVSGPSSCWDAVAVINDFGYSTDWDEPTNEEYDYDNDYDNDDYDYDDYDNMD